MSDEINIRIPKTLKKFLIGGAVFILFLFILSLINYDEKPNQETKQQEQIIPNKIVQEIKPKEPINFVWEINETIRPNWAVFFDIIEPTNENYPIKVEYDLKANRGFNVYFVESKKDFDYYLNHFDRAREKFNYYEGCKSLGVASFKGICSVKNGGGLILASKGQETIVNGVLNITAYLP